MATQRIISQEKTFLDQDELPAGATDTSPAVPKEVIYKLLAFTLAMVVIPIGSYFVTVNTIFKGNSSFAGGLAALMANVVLVGYIVVAMQEDQSDNLDEKKKKPETKKDR